MYCNKCGIKVNNTDAHYCPFCGQQLETVFVEKKSKPIVKAMIVLVSLCVAIVAVFAELKYFGVIGDESLMSYIETAITDDNNSVDNSKKFDYEVGSVIPAQESLLVKSTKDIWEEAEERGFTITNLQVVYNMDGNLVAGASLNEYGHAESYGSVTSKSDEKYPIYYFDTNITEDGIGCDSECRGYGLYWTISVCNDTWTASQPVSFTRRVNKSMRDDYSCFEFYEKNINYEYDAKSNTFTTIDVENEEDEFWKPYLLDRIDAETLASLSWDDLYGE